MSVYVITGASKGIGFEIVKQVSEDPQNVVVGLVRDKAGTQKKVAAELGERSNVHILHGDLTSYASLKQAAADTAKIVGDRGVDYLVANAGNVSTFDAYDTIGTLGEKPEELEKAASDSFSTNVVGNTHLFNLYIPLVLKGKVKKVIAITSGHADLELINKFDVSNCAIYAASKAALNVIVAKFNTQYRKDGVLFVSISPGVVDVGHFTDLTPAQTEALVDFSTKVAAYAPHFKGPTPVDEAVKTNRATWEKLSIEDGHGGAFLSHFGNKQWV